MRHPILPVACLVLLAFALLPTAAPAAWTADGNLVSPPALLDPWEPRPVATPDGGVIVVYVAHESGYHDVWAQRYDPWGNPLWGDGRPVVVASNEQYAPAAVADGAGGVIVAWTDFRTGTSEGIYAQRLDGDGNALWTAGGVPLVAGSASSARICTDHAGGAVVAWRDGRNADPDIYAQRLSDAGTPLWTAGGLGVCTTTGNQQDFVMVDDGRGGAYFVWSYPSVSTSSYDIHAQRVNGDGWVEWSPYPDGYPLCAVAGDQTSPVALADGHGRLIAAWLDGRYGAVDIFAQLVTSYAAHLWATGGTEVVVGAAGRYDPAIATDGQGGAFVVWDQGDVWAQRIAVDGSLPWGGDGIPVCAVYGSQNFPEIVPDGVGGAVIAWEDGRYTAMDIYAQRINGEGSTLWAEGGVVLCAAMGGQSRPRLAGDGAGGAYAAWEDDLRTDYVRDIYLQRVDRWGNWGYPAPTINTVADIPGDQGWQVNVSWDASRLDVWPAEALETYSLWRALAGDAAKALPGDAVLVDLDRFTPGQKGRIVRADGADKTLYWEYLGEIGARNLPTYAAAAPTLFNLTPECQDYHAFQVVAHGGTPLGAGYWAAKPDTGRSVDNLAPTMPVMVAGEQVYDPVGLALTWAPNPEPDLGAYTVHRGGDPGFVPDTANLVATVTEPAARDDDWQLGSRWYYKIAARDIHGNTGPYALLAPDDVSAVADQDVPETTALAGIHPNPLNPRGEIMFTVRDPAHVVLTVRDLAGRRVAVLTDRVWPRGTHSVAWSGRDDAGRGCASGLYLVEFRAVGRTMTDKLVLLR